MAGVTIKLKPKHPRTALTSKTLAQAPTQCFPAKAANHAREAVFNPEQGHRSKAASAATQAASMPLEGSSLTHTLRDNPPAP
ncbi:MAG: hypothetical protein QXP58_07610 [Thermoprotei archaeon]